MDKRYVTPGMGSAERRMVRVEARRRWLVRRVWVVDADGTKRGGTVWSVEGDHARIRVDQVPGVTVLPVAARGERWDFLESQDAAPDQ